MDARAAGLDTLLEGAKEKVTGVPGGQGMMLRLLQALDACDKTHLFPLRFVSN